MILSRGAGSLEMFLCTVHGKGTVWRLRRFIFSFPQTFLLFFFPYIIFRLYESNIYPWNGMERPVHYAIIPRESFYFLSVMPRCFYIRLMANQYLAVPAIACAYFWRSTWIWAYGTVTLSFCSSFWKPSMCPSSCISAAEECAYCDCQIWLAVFLLGALVRMSNRVYVPQSHPKNLLNRNTDVS